MTRLRAFLRGMGHGFDMRTRTPAQWAGVALSMAFLVGILFERHCR